MAPTKEYTAEEATRLYLDRLKQSDPNPALRKYIDEVEDELLRKSAERTRPKKRRRAAVRNAAAS